MLLHIKPPILGGSIGGFVWSALTPALVDGSGGGLVNNHGGEHDPVRAAAKHDRGRLLGVIHDLLVVFTSAREEALQESCNKAIYCYQIGLQVRYLVLIPYQ
jgi:hypothetical protein